GLRDLAREPAAGRPIEAAPVREDRVADPHRPARRARGGRREMLHREVDPVLRPKLHDSLKLPRFVARCNGTWAWHLIFWGPYQTARGDETKHAWNEPSPERDPLRHPGPRGHRVRGVLDGLPARLVLRHRAGHRPRRARGRPRGLLL